MQALSFFVSMGASYLQVIRYDDRCFLRDGYHRSTRLLRHGIHQTPCIFLEQDKFEEFGLPPGSLTHETMYGSRPPSLPDFWDDGVSTGGRQGSDRALVQRRL